MPHTAGQLNRLSRHRGNSLLIAVAVLLAFALLVLAGSHFLLGEQRISANQNDRQFAMQLAELALRDGEMSIDLLDRTAQIQNKTSDQLYGDTALFTSTCESTVPGVWNKGLCLISSRAGNGALAAWKRTQTVSGQTVPILHPCGNSREYVYESAAGKCSKSATVTPGKRVWANPRYIVELLDQNFTGQRGKTGRLYRITAQAWGRNRNTQVTLQSFYFMPSPTGAPWPYLALGRDGKGLYALDLTKATGNTPSGIAANIGQSDYNSEDAAPLGCRGSSLGDTFGRPVIARISQPGGADWAVITGNGDDSRASNNRSSIYFFKTGSKALLGNVLIPTSGNRPGIGGIAVLDSNSDGVADFIYASDRNGDIWRVDLKTDPATPLDQATSVHKVWSGSPTQPITITPAIYRINDKEVMVLFGTGSLLQDADKTDKTPQAVYGIHDDLSAPPVTYSYATDHGSNGRLLQQTIDDEVDSGGESYRKVSSNTPPADGSKSGGWYLDLPVDAVSAERVTQPMMVFSNGVFFSTQIPAAGSGDHCSSIPGSGWVMALGALTGAAPRQPVIDPGYADFSDGPAIIAGFKVSGAGMLSRLGLASSNRHTARSADETSSGLINNMSNDMEPGRVAGLTIMFSCRDGEICTKKLLGNTTVAQGYRTSWREIY